MKKEKSDSDSNSVGLSFLYLVLALYIANKIYGMVVIVFANLILFYDHHASAFTNSFYLAIFLMVLFFVAMLWNMYVAYQTRRALTGKSDTSFFIGKDLESKKDFHIREEFLATHAEAISGTGDGKTTLLLQMMAQGIARGRGLMVVDGKSDRSTLEQLYAHAVQAGRKADFMLFSLNRPEASSTFNPFCDGTPEQIAERIFGALEITHDYYGPLQFAALRCLIALLMRRGEKPMPGVIRELLRDQGKLKEWITDLPASSLLDEIKTMLSQKPEEFRENYSGLVTALGHFSEGAAARLYNTKTPEINLLEAIRRNKIIYFQLPTMQFPFLGAATGKLVLQCLQSAVSQIQDSGLLPKNLFPVYLDDFNDYLYPKFASLLNKSRSANVGILFSHQSMGDLDKVGPEFKEIVLTNTKLKFLLRLSDPQTAEHFSKIIGTKTTEKSTSRWSRGFWGNQDTGEKSVRETEEYRIHPNIFKEKLERGQGIVIIPYPEGRIIRKVAFHALEPLPEISLPLRNLPEVDLIRESRYPGKVQPDRKKTKPEKEPEQKSPVKKEPDNDGEGYEE